MNIIDIILLIILIPAVISGLRRGFIDQLVGLVSLILGILLAFHFSQELGVWLGNYIHVSNNLLNIISFIVIFFLCAGLLELVGKALEGIFKLALLGWLNRLLGMVLSLAATFIFVGLTILFIHHLGMIFSISTPQLFQESVIYNWMQDAILNIFPQLKNLFTA